MYVISYLWTRGEVFKLSSESKHLGLLFQLVDQLKQFVPNLPVSAAHKTLTFRLKHEDFPNLPVSSDHKKRPQGKGRPSLENGRRYGHTDSYEHDKAPCVGVG